MAKTVEALRRANLDGWPLKWRTRPARPREKGFAWEAVRVERRSVPASLLSLSGYTRTDGEAGAGPLMELSPREKGKLQEAMRKLSPERQRELEQLMNPPADAGGR
jgi:hypothetical protein